MLEEVYTTVEEKEGRITISIHADFKEGRTIIQLPPAVAMQEDVPEIEQTPIDTSSDCQFTKQREQPSKKEGSTKQASLFAFMRQ